MAEVLQKFKAPKADNREQWDKIRLLIEHGFFFQSIYDVEPGAAYTRAQTVPYPRTLSEAREWVKQWAHKAIDPAPIDSDDA